MIKVITERPIPPGFDVTDDTQVRRHAQIAVDAMAAQGGRMHWICSYITEDKLFGVVVMEDEAVLKRFQDAAGMTGQSIKIHRVQRVIDAASAG